MNEKDFAELSAGHALAALSPEDERAYQDALAAHPEWQHHVDADAHVAGFLAEGAGEEAPPAEIRARLLAQISGMPQAAAPAVADEPVGVAAEPAAAAERVSEDEPREPVHAGPSTEAIQTVERRTWTRGLFALVASAALLVGVGWGVGSLVERARTPLEVQALEQIESAPDAQTVTGQFSDGGEAVLHWSDELDKVVLTTDDAPEIPADRSFELWFVRGDEPISAGVFDPSDEVTALLSGDFEPGDVIAVTVEQKGGSPDGSPTTDPIITIPTA
ncbi:anti-sigma factor domain-containing protein [Microbacterium sp. NPDC077663]|uniref:anti-sigma factor n=1 Tax=Microbacterium sp. NPDC077663 TaxID=3364189 RepID=UPI0037C83BDE